MENSSNILNLNFISISRCKYCLMIKVSNFQEHEKIIHTDKNEFKMCKSVHKLITKKTLPGRLFLDEIVLNI